MQVVQLRATHTDNVLGARITYTMSGDVVEKNSPFSISSPSGTIQVSDSSKLNYEDTQRYRIMVVAFSGG